VTSEQIREAVRCARVRIGLDCSYDFENLGAWHMYDNDLDPEDRLFQLYTEVVDDAAWTVLVQEMNTEAAAIRAALEAMPPTEWFRFDFQARTLEIVALVTAKDERNLRRGAVALKDEDGHWKSMCGDDVELGKHIVTIASHGLHLTAYTRAGDGGKE